MEDNMAGDFILDHRRLKRRENGRMEKELNGLEKMEILKMKIDNIYINLKSINIYDDGLDIGRIEIQTLTLTCFFHSCW